MRTRAPRYLRDLPPPGRAVNGHHRLALAVLVAEVDEHGVAIVLGPQAMDGVAILGEDARSGVVRIGDERGPARRAVALNALVAALDARDSYSGRHSNAVVELAEQVAEELGLPQSSMGEIKHVALLHDIGKIGIPDSILVKPGPLSDAEWELMRSHSIIGAEIVASIASIAHLAGAIRAEHERWDGMGYPDGLVREQIPLASRIALACDAYDAMTSDRPYRDQLDPEYARRELAEHAGAQFDADVVAALLRVLGR
ncbi:MAG: hypothetical protein QOI48_4723 [Solirubrobacteraceae bacterium]|nr:hypothetical protein [Solirubrobacteraceae bacterium]